MLPHMCVYLVRSKQKKSDRQGMETETKDRHLQYSVTFNKKPSETQTRFALRSDKKNRNEDIKAKKKREMANKVSNFSDLIHRVAASCLLHPLARGHESAKQPEDGEEEEEVEGDEEEDKEEEEREFCRVLERLGEVESLMSEVFETVSAVKRAYVSLQEAHCPWDPEKMRFADVAVVAELRRLGRLRERFKRKGGGGGGVAPLREAVAPYEAALEELKREVRSKEMEIESLKGRLRKTNGGKRGRIYSQKRVSCSQVASAPSPTPELFEMCMNQVKETSKSFTALLLSLMRSARWDISAAVRSIEGSPDCYTNAVGSHHAKHALESYVSRKIFQGFENETFYIDGSLSSLINPEKFRRDCFTQFRDMKAMDPSELLGILPTCHFGKFCGKKFLSIVHPKMEESFFGDLEHRRLVLAGNHPRTQFYGDFLGLAKAVWLLHLLAFALQPPPCHFQASKGADFHPDYMESVIKFNGCKVPSTQVVGISVSPGFKLFNGSVIKAGVYLVSRT